MSVRVRFAPSPTGPLHIGGLRTALYNYVFAKQHGGKFILRIEDTDQKRYVEGAEDYISESLTWAGLEPDEGPRSGGDYGPYRQSERSTLYAKFAAQLVEDGKAYYAFDSPEELEMMRERLKKEGNYAPKYDGEIRKHMRNSLTLDASEVDEMIESGTPYTIRLLVPNGERIAFADLVRGEISFASEDLDDKVLMKADGLPTYHLANVVDDHHMEISHVIRGEDWVPSTGHHVLLYRAFGWEESMPEFAHLPLLLKPTGKGKLGKRDGAKFGFPVFPLDWNDTSGEVFSGFRESGFLPDAVLNFIALLGWNPGTEQELFDLAELGKAFSLDGITKAGALFDFDKGRWFNQQYIQQLSSGTLAKMVRPLLLKKGFEPSDEFLIDYCDLFKIRAVTLDDFAAEGTYFFEEPTEFDEKTIAKKWSQELAGHFSTLNLDLSNVSDFNAENIENTVKPYIVENELKFGDVLPMLRVAVSGNPQGPDVFKMLALLGKDKVIKRILAFSHSPIHSSHTDPKEEEKEKRTFHEDLEGFDIRVNEFGEMQTSFEIDKINKFLNENVDDKKLQGDVGDVQEEE